MFSELVKYIPKIMLNFLVVRASLLWFWYRLISPYHSGLLNTLRPRQNGCADDTLNALSRMKMYEFRLTLHSHLIQFVPEGQINNIPPLVQIMAWRRPGDKLLSDPMMTHIDVTRSQLHWSKQDSPSGATLKNMGKSVTWIHWLTIKPRQYKAKTCVYCRICNISKSKCLMSLQ